MALVLAAAPAHAEEPAAPAADPPAPAPAAEPPAPAPAAEPPAPAPPLTWTVGVPLARAVATDGTLAVPAGVAVLLVTARPDTVTVGAADGEEVDVRGVPGGLLVPAAATSRAIGVYAPPGTAVRVHRSDAPGTDAAWDAWERAAVRAVRDDESVPAPPWGGARLAASVRLRARAVADAEVARLGLAYDAASVRPLGGGTHLEGPEVPVTAGDAVVVYGPGSAVVRVQAPLGPLARFAVGVRLDGEAAVYTPVATTGAAPVPVRVWLPPGRHTLAASAGRDDVRFTVQAAPLHPRLFAPALDAGPRAGIAEAERLWLYGRIAAARAAFAPFAGAPGPAGELARVRLLASATDPAEAARLATFGPELSPEGVELLADAVVAAAALLPDDVVLAAAMRARDPDLVALARWLDATSGVRPRGLALLATATPAVPFGPTPASRGVRLAGLDTRWTRLVATEAAGPPVPKVTAAGPGVPRVEVCAGQEAAVTLPARAAGRFPVLRLDAAAGARFRVGGAEWSASPGPLDVALPAGAQALAVGEGCVRVLDAELATGGTRVYAWDAAPVPASWELPDEGVGADLAVVVERSVGADAVGVRAAAAEPPAAAAAEPAAAAAEPAAAAPPAGAWLAVFDDGTVTPFTPRPDGTAVSLRAGPHARRVTLLGPSGAHAGVAIRAVFPPPAPAPLAPPDDEAAALAALEALTRAVDRGDATARAERARLLGQLGQVGYARRDVAALLAEGDVATGRMLAAAVVPEVPSAPAPGPASPSAALAAAGRPAAPPTDAAALDALAETLGQPALHVAAAETWLATGDPARALLSARAAGPAGADALTTVEARLRWTPVAFADASAGLVQVPRAPGAAPDPSLWERVRAALLALPWPAAEGVVVRAPTSDLVAVRGATLDAQLFCRDEGEGGRPCRVDVRFDDTRRTVDIPDGTTLPLAFAGSPGPHALEVAPRDQDRAVGVRVSVDGALLPPAGTTTGLRAAPGLPIVLTVVTPSVLRVAVARGEARVVSASSRGAASAAPATSAAAPATTAATTALPPGETLLPLPGPGPARVVIAGDADLLLAVGELAPAPPDPVAPVVPPPAPRLPIEAVAPLLARAALPGSPARAVPGDHGTWAFTLAALHTRVRAPVEPWSAMEAETGWMRAGPLGWATASAWTRGPGWAGGFDGELGRAWDDGFVAVGARAGVGRGVVDAAGGAGLTARARRTFTFGQRHTARVEARGRLGWWSPAPITPVDPRAWSTWGADHPAWLALSGGWTAAPWRDVRVDAEITATSNTGPSLDHVAGTLGVDLLVGSSLVVSPTATLRWRFADDHRARAGAWADLRLRADWVRWHGAGYRAQVWGEGGLVQGAPVGRIGMTVLATGGRGLHDLPPGAEAFRDARLSAEGERVPPVRSSPRLAGAGRLSPTSPRPASAGRCSAPGGGGATASRDRGVPAPGAAPPPPTLRPGLPSVHDHREGEPTPREGEPAPRDEEPSAPTESP